MWLLLLAVEIIITHEVQGHHASIRDALSQPTTKKFKVAYAGMTSFKDKYLNGRNNISQYVAKDQNECNIKCFTNVTCYSTNFEVNQSVCIMIAENPYKDYKSVQTKKNWILSTIRNACTKKPCPDGIPCVPDYLNNNHMCTGISPVAHIPFDGSFDNIGTENTQFAKPLQSRFVSTPDHSKKVLYCKASDTNSAPRCFKLYAPMSMRPLDISYPVRAPGNGLTFCLWFKTVAEEYKTKLVVLLHTSGSTGFQIFHSNWNRETRTVTWKITFEIQHKFMKVEFIGPDALNWVHLVLVYSFSERNLKVYFNGKLIKTASEGPTTKRRTYLTPKWYINASYYAFRKHAGFFHDLMFYERQLKSNEVKTLYREQY